MDLLIDVNWLIDWLNDWLSDFIRSNNFFLCSLLDSECDVRPGVRAAGTQWGAGQAYWHVGGQAGRSHQQPAGSALSDLPSHNSAAAGPPGRLRAPLLPCFAGLGTLLDSLQTAALALHRSAHFLRQQLTWAWTCSPLPKVSDLFT